VNVDALIREANPVAEEIESPDSAHARRVLDGILALPRRYPAKERRNLIVVGIVAILVVAVVMSQLVSNSLIRPSTAAAAELRRLARISGASKAAPTTLGPGQYLYSEIEALQGAGFFTGKHPAADQFDITYRKTVQEWQAASGAGREVVTYDSPPTFTTPASRAGWVLSGRPSIAPPSDEPNGSNEWSWSASSKFAARPPSDSTLPIRVGKLQVLLQHGGRDLPKSLVANVDTLSTPAGTFGAAAEILETPSTGSTPELRSALYKVMADVPGVQLLGRAIDRVGRTGIEIAAPPSDGERTQLIINPSTGNILQTELVDVDSSELSRGARKYFGSKKGEVFSWTDYLKTGVVNSAIAVNAQSMK
jgi:hypothetical protein